MTEKQARDIITDEEWLRKLEMATARTSRTVYNEPGNTVNHAKRTILATEMARSPASWARVLALHVGGSDAFLALTVPQGNQISLADLETRILDAYNVLAGAP